MKSILFIGLVDLLLPGSVQETSSNDHNFWLSKIRNEHPRLFFNEKSFKQVRERTLNEESALFAEMKSRVDALIGQEIIFKDPLVADGAQNIDHEYGICVAEAALVYLLSKDKKYLELSKDILRKTVDYYNFRNEHGLNIQRYAFSIINALAAYDWIYDDLTKKERTDISVPFLQAINDMLPSEKRKPFFRENAGGIKTGFYGSSCLAWYAGLVVYHIGIDDSLSKKLPLKGYDDHIAFLEYRWKVSGDDGGVASAVLGYCMGAYPWAEFNFFHIFHSATGVDISTEWPYVQNFVNYIFWNWLPGNREFGYGDANHYTNNLLLNSLHIHLSQMIHFYGKTQPELIAMTKWMQTKIKRQKQDVFLFTRFLLTNTCNELKPDILPDNLPKARYFENMGQIFIRLGLGADDTYALFTAGGILIPYRHYDNNNFVIFKKSFLTVDTGTRPQPDLHLSHYYSRTVVHNCITIRMPGEEKSSDYPNDGGQNNILGSKIIAFDEKEDYVYIAGDTTKSYNKNKSNQVVRQFVLLPPDIFVVFDRVNSIKVEYSKTWLLHMAEEPMINGQEFHAGQGEGMLFCKTVFPESAKLTKIGESGKQFWSDGRNWPLLRLKPGDWNYVNMKKCHRIPVNYLASGA